MSDRKQEFIKGLMAGVEDVKTAILQDIDHNTYKLNFLTKVKAYIAEELQKFEQSIETCP